MSAPALESRPFGGAVADRLAGRWHLLALGGILLVAGVLNFARLDQNGYANDYYAAAVRSMLSSWRNFFFVSFDPGGLVSVDKPPLALWLQGGSAELFGYSGVSLLLPQAAAGVAAVAVLYLVVARYFGRVAGLVAALALALSPVSVAVNRDNNPDALLAFLFVVAVYLGLRAAESGRLRWLLPTALVVGLAFNTKMLAGLMVVPALGLAYLLFAPRSWPTRVWHLAAAGAVLVVVSGAWIVAVELTPASERPYVGSTSDNSALSLALDYNGLGRVTGQTGGTSFGGGGGGGGGLGGAFSGSPGLFRLFNDALGDQGAWLIPFALIGGLSALVAALAARRRRELAALTAIGGWFATTAFVLSYASGIIHTYYASMLAPATGALVGIGAVSLWRDARRGRARLLFPAAAIAATAWVQIDLLRRSGYLPGLQTLVILTAAGALAALGALALRESWTPQRRALIAGGAIGAAVLGLLAAPAAWAKTTLDGPVNGVFPGAGPSYISGLASNRDGGPRFGRGGGRPSFAPPGSGNFRGGGRGFGFGPPPAGGFGGGQGRFGGGTGGFGAGSADTEAALAYAKANGGSERFTLIVSSEQAAAPFVIDGEPVAAMGGFTGRETVLTSAYLAELVRSGDARYFLLGGGGPGGTNAAAQLVASSCEPVSAAAWGGPSTSSGLGASGLYDCAGRADEIAGTTSTSLDI